MYLQHNVILGLLLEQSPMHQSASLNLSGEHDTFPLSQSARLNESHWITGGVLATSASTFTTRWSRAPRYEAAPAAAIAIGTMTASHLTFFFMALFPRSMAMVAARLRVGVAAELVFAAGMGKRCP